jgi:hypothetical protein
VLVGALVDEDILVDKRTLLVASLVRGTDAVEDTGGESRSIHGAAESEDDGGDGKSHDEWGVEEWVSEKRSWVGRLMKSWVGEEPSG